MQKDVHYNATLTIAQSAGFKPYDAYRIAQACQFIDDNIESIFLPKNDRYLLPTAHHWNDKANVDPDSHLNVWVPFHFLPSNVGDNHIERLVCRWDNHEPREALRSKMITYLKDNSSHFGMDKEGELDGLYLIGALAHILWDTFAHTGFCGTTADVNNVEPGSLKVKPFSLSETKVSEDKFLKSTRRKFAKKYLQERDSKADKRFYRRPAWQRFFRRIWNNLASYFVTELSGDNGALGHAAIMTMADMPFISFEYENEKGEHVLRHNPSLFMSASTYIGEFLRDCYKIFYDTDEGTGDIISLNTLSEVFNHFGEKDERANVWVKLNSKMRYINFDYIEVCDQYERNSFAEATKWLRLTIFRMYNKEFNLNLEDVLTGHLGERVRRW